jgi:hypothetical protein
MNDMAPAPLGPSRTKEPTTSLLAATTLASAQQPAPSAGSGMNMTKEQVNDANIQLMRQDVRSERKKVVAANLPLTETEATKFRPVYDRYIAMFVSLSSRSMPRTIRP